MIQTATRLIADVRAELRGSSPLESRILVFCAAICVLLPVLAYSQAAGDIGVSLIALLFLARSAAMRDFAWVRAPWMLAALAFWAYIVGRGLVSGHAEKSAGAALVWVRFPVFVAAVTLLIARSRTLGCLILGAIVAVSLAASADTVFQMFARVDVFGRPAIGDRLTGPLGSPAIAAMIFLSGVPAIAWLMIGAGEPTWSLRRRVLAGAGLALIVAAIVLSGERMILLLTLACIGVFVVTLFRLDWRVIAGLVVGGVCLVGTVYTLHPALLARHLSTYAEVAKGGHSIYFEIWRAALAVFADNSVFGTGLRTFRYVCFDYAPAAQAKEICGNLHPHQMWLEILSETGVVGAAILIATFVLALAPAVRMWRDWRGNALLAGATLGVLIRLWPIATSGSFFVNRNEVVFWPMLALAVALSRRDRSAA